MTVSFLTELVLYLNKGGWVMWPLVISTFVLWYGLGYRYSVLQRGNRRSVRVLVRLYLKGYDRKPKGIVDTAVIKAINVVRQKKICDRRLIEAAFIELANDIGRYSVLIRTIVLIAPLLGLLGTVSGMIQMFDSLGDAGFYTQSGGIAGGISKALFTTQMGLAVAVPGMILGRILDKRESNLARELDQIKDILVYEKVGDICVT